MNMKHRTAHFLRHARLLLLAAPLMVCPCLLAQSYSIDWFTIDGGGGTSTGGVYSVSGTIGQPDAGAPMTGGQYSLTGGFWSLYAVQTPGAPPLSIAHTTTNTVVVSWPLPADGWILEQVGSLAGSPPPWTQILPPYQTNTTEAWVIVTVPAGNKFYRLRKP